MIKNLTKHKIKKNSFFNNHSINNKETFQKMIYLNNHYNNKTLKINKQI